MQADLPPAPQRKRKRGNGDGGTGGWSSDDSEAAEERAEHHYMLKVGDEFDKGRYTVSAQLGKGTFGRVVEMYDLVEKMDVAVKVVRAVEKCAACRDRSPCLCMHAPAATFIYAVQATPGKPRALSCTPSNPAADTSRAVCAPGMHARPRSRATLSARSSARCRPTKRSPLCTCSGRLNHAGACSGPTERDTRRVQQPHRVRLHLMVPTCVPRAIHVCCVQALLPRLQ